MMGPARRAAVEAVLAVERRKRDLGTAIERARRTLIDPRDRALATEIAQGVFRWRGAIDFVLARHVRAGLAALELPVLAVLRTAAYQLLWLDRVPAHAVVHDAVELVRVLGQPNASGLVNAVLRRLPSRVDDAALPGPDSADFWTATCSLPTWLARRWRARVGDARTAAWARFALEPPPLTLRVNTWRISRADAVSRLADEGVVARELATSPTAVTIDAGDLAASGIMREGLAGIQDEGSQLVAAIVRVRPGERVLDLCAAPGGKALAMYAGADARAAIVAADHRPTRVALLADTIRHAHAHGVALVRADATGGVPFAPVFDCVVADVPCSGLGTLRRDPDIKWMCREDDLPRMAATGRRILAGAATAVAPGGRLVFATCTTEPEENDAVVEAFLADHPDFGIEHPAAPWSDRFLDRDCLRTTPDQHALEGFFAAVLRRTRGRAG